MSTRRVVVLGPGQGAQHVGMGRAWAGCGHAAGAVFAAADECLGEDVAGLGAPISTLCFEGAAERLNRTDVSQPAIFACSVACWAGLREQAAESGGEFEIVAAAGLSLGEYTALHLAGVFDFETGLRLVADRGRLMQEAAEHSAGGMVALIGADERQAAQVCEQAAAGNVLVPANFNAPGQIVLSGHQTACERAPIAAEELGLRATPLTVAGAFHSPLMQPAADRMAEILAEAILSPLRIPVWSNVTGLPHESADLELLRKRLVEQIVSPVRWAQGCQNMVADARIARAGGDNAPAEFHELAPGSVLRGLMRRIDRNTKVTSHDEP